LERALAPFRAFEVRASEYAVWVLDQVGAAGVVAAYSTFFRADLEAITIFHRTGRAPVWRPFLARWKASMDCAPFTPRPVPVFRPVPIERQEVKQQIEKGGPGRPALELNEQSR
jgi:hypothetical protein